MRQLLVISLVSIHLFGNTELGQVFKMPRLLAHFHQHHQLDPSISFIDFILMHYAGDDGTTADDEQDNQLPFHNITHNTLPSLFAPMVRELSSPVCTDPGHPVYFHSLERPILPGNLSVILQPPRQA